MLVAVPVAFVVPDGLSGADGSVCGAAEVEVSDVIEVELQFADEAGEVFRGDDES